jgi:hypothetical protein
MDGTTTKTCEQTGLVEERQSIGFVLRGPKVQVSKASMAIKNVLDGYPEILTVYRTSTFGKLWIKEGESKEA